MLRLRIPRVLPAALLLALAVAAQQQSSSSSPPQQSSSQQQTSADQKKPAKQDKKDKPAQNQSPAQQNAFPEAQSEKAAEQAHPAQPQGQQQNPPAAPTPSTQPRSEAEQNPFPEAQSEKAAKQAQQRENPAPSSQTSTSSPDSSSSAVPGLNLPTQSAKQPGPPVLTTSLGRQDTKVGNFYLQSGDWKGAYSRFLEATQADPGNADAVYGLAASAQHLGYRKVAIQNYQLYLSALPDGPRAKDCRKALKDLGAKR